MRKPKFAYRPADPRLHIDGMLYFKEVSDIIACCQGLISVFLPLPSNRFTHAEPSPSVEFG
jgi:hypothetical protein